MKSQEPIYQSNQPHDPATPSLPSAVQEKIKEIEKKYSKPLAEVLDDRRNVLDRIAKMVGNDFGMHVAFGQIGGGSYFVSEDPQVPKDKWNSITFDPLILLEAEGTDEFVAAHEGAHRAITRTIAQVGLKPAYEIAKLSEKVGRAYIFNVLEDPAVNDWVRGLYPRIGGIIDATYDEQFAKEGAVMSTPQIQQITSSLGYVPNFVTFGSETMRRWHKKSYSQTLPPAVRDALDQTERFVQSFHREIPYSNPTERDIMHKAKTRWQIYDAGIWPLVQKLIEEDLIDENLKQYLKDQLQKALDAEHGKTDASQQSGQNLEELMKQFGFDDVEKKEMREKMQQALERKKEAMKNAEAKLENGTMTQIEHDEAAKDITEGLPLDMKSMSGALKKKIEDALGTESKGKQGEMSAKAQQSLEHAEDVANESLRAKLGSHEQSHAERREHKTTTTQAEREATERIAQELAKQKSEENAFSAWQQQEHAKLTEWEKVASARGPLIDKLYRRIEEYFQKRRHPRWKPGYSAGQRLDLRTAMQFEADPRNYVRLWEKKTIPEKRDHAFEILNDQSGSMREGGKAENDLIAKAMVVEVLTALGIRNEVLGFTTPQGGGKHKDYVEVYKSFDQDLNEMRETLMPELSQIVHDGGGMTPTYTATEIASSRLAQWSHVGTARDRASFLIVITDGRPQGDPKNSSLEGLRDLNTRLSAERDQVIIGMGIGEGIREEDLKLAYGEHRYVYAKTPEEFPEKMAALLEAIFTQTQAV